MNYCEFLKSKELQSINAGFSVERSDINDMLFPFQKDKVEVTDGKVFPYDPTYGNSKGVTFNANDAKTEDS